MGNKEKGKGKGGVFKAAVVGAASGVIPKVVAVTKTSTRKRLAARRVRKGMGTRGKARRTSSRGIIDLETLAKCLFAFLCASFIV